MSHHVFISVRGPEAQGDDATHCPSVSLSWHTHVGGSPGTAQATHAAAREGDATPGRGGGAWPREHCTHPSFPHLPGPAALAQLLAHGAATQG